MPKLTHAVPKYRKHRATGQAIVTIHGVDHYLGPHKSKTSVAEYDRLIGEYLTRGRRAPIPEPDACLVKVVVLAYWKHAKGYYVKDGKETKEVNAVKTVLKPVRRLYGDKPVGEFGPVALKTIRNAWIKAGHSRGVINDNVDRIRRAFRWAAAEEMIPADIPLALANVSGLRKGRTEAREPEPIKPIDLVTVEATMGHLCEVVKDMIRLQLVAGMRPSEVCAIKPCDIDRVSDVWEYAVAGNKMEHRDRIRTVYIGPEGQSILSKYLLRDEQKNCFSPREAVEQQREAKNAARATPANQGNRRGRKHGGLKGQRGGRLAREHYDSDSYRRAIHRACDKAFLLPEPIKGDELKIWQSEHRWSPNRLRHTKGTEIRRRYARQCERSYYPLWVLLDDFATRDMIPTHGILRHSSFLGDGGILCNVVVNYA